MDYGRGKTVSCDNFVGLSVQELTAVPFALYAPSVEGATGADGPQGIAGNDGADGDSAYDIWLSLGNTGTQQDFIDSLTGPQGPQGTSSSGDGKVIVSNTSEINTILTTENNLNGASDGDLVVNINDGSLYLYLEDDLSINHPVNTALSLFDNFSYTSESYTSNLSYIISFKVSKRIKISLITTSNGGNYGSAKGHLFEDNNDDISDGFGARMWRYTSGSGIVGEYLIPGKPYRILYIGYGNNYNIETFNPTSYDYDSTLFTNLEIHKSSDLLNYNNFPENYNIETTTTMPIFGGQVGYVSFYGISYMAVPRLIPVSN